MSSADNDATSRLVLLYQQNPLNLLEVRQAVRDGANVLHAHQAVYSLHQPILHSLVCRSEVEAVKVCLSTPLVLSFVKVTNYRLENMLHLVCRVGSRDALTEMLDAMIHRLETHPHDEVDWTQKNVFRQDFIHVAISQGKLSAVWPLVGGRVPYYADQVEPIVLHASVFEWDWAQLSEKEKENFCLKEGLKEPNEALHFLSFKGSPETEMVTDCVAHGADVLYSVDPQKYNPSLHMFILNGAVECVEACLKTSRAIDFTVTNSPRERNTPLHLVCQLRNDAVALKILRMILLRLDEERSWARDDADRVDWSQENSDGHDFLSCAVKANKIPLFWSSISSLPYFRHMDMPAL